MNWLLRSLQDIPYPEWTGEGARQLFAVHTGFSSGPTETAFPVTATISQACARILCDIMPRSFARADDAIADTLNWFHGVRSHNLMQVRAARNGTLSIRQEQYSIGINPDSVQSGSGYQIYSENTNDLVGQIILLIRIASVWEELRGLQSAPV